jgi:hypothetical protein
VPEPSAATADPLRIHRFAYPASPGADPSTTASPPPHREPDGPRSPEISVADAIRALNSVLPASPARAGRLRQVIRGRSNCSTGGPTRLTELLNSEPLNIEPLTIEPPNIEPPNIEPPNIEPLNIEPLNIESLNMNRST